MTRSLLLALPPLVGFGAGGYYSCVPLAYVTSLKVVVRGARVPFHQVNCATYAPETGLTSDDPATAASDRLRAAATFLGSTGEDLSRFAVPPGSRVERHDVARTLRPGGRAVLFESQSGGRLVGFRIGPASALMADGRATLVRVYWDGASQPAIEDLVSDLFGGARGRPAMAGLLAGTLRDTSYLWFPMPYDRSTRGGRRPSPPSRLASRRSPRRPSPASGASSRSWATARRSSGGTS